MNLKTISIKNPFSLTELFSGIFSRFTNDIAAIDRKESSAEKRVAQRTWLHDKVRTKTGTVTLVGFGPGNPDLLTLGGDRALVEADVIFHDDLLDKDFLKKYKGEKVYVGKRCHKHSYEQDEIQQLLLNAAFTGKKVVRLKGGDPMVFGHGGEEVDFLRQHKVPVQVIPGISTGIAVASLLQFPLTHRGVSSSVAFVTGHKVENELPCTDTVVCFMAANNIRQIAANAIEKGKNPETPVLLAHNVSLPDQQEFHSTLGELAASETKFPTPLIIVIGDVVNLKPEIY